MPRRIHQLTIPLNDGMSCDLEIWDEKPHLLYLALGSTEAPEGYAVELTPTQARSIADQLEKLANTIEEAQFKAARAADPNALQFVLRKP